MQRDSASHSVRHYADLDAPEALGRLAGERTVKRLNPGKLASGTMPILFDPRVGGSLIGAPARRDERPRHRPQDQLPARPRGRAAVRSAASSSSTIRTGRAGSSPSRSTARASRPRPRRLIDGGRLTGWLLERASARQLGLETTGHASRGIGGAPGAGATNVHLEPGALTPGRADGATSRTASTSPR